MISHMLHVHLAAAHTEPAAVAAVHIHFDAGQGEAVEEAVDRSQGADKTAEGTVAEGAGKPDHQHDHPFAGKENLKLIERRGVGLILQKADRPFQRPCRADILAEAGQRDPLIDSVPDGNRDHKDRQKQIFQIGKPSGHTAFFNLEHRDLMQQFLHQSKRTEPSADRSSQNHSKERKNTQYIPGRGMAGGIQRVLKRAQRAACDRPGAGITVKTGNARAFERPGINMSVYESFQIRVIQKRSIQLNQLPGSGTESGGLCLSPLTLHFRCPGACFFISHSQILISPPASLSNPRGEVLMKTTCRPALRRPPAERKHADLHVSFSVQQLIPVRHIRCIWMRLLQVPPPDRRF